MSLLPSPFRRKRNIELRQDQLSTDDLREALQNPPAPSDESDTDPDGIFSLSPPSANDRFDPKAVLISAPEPEPKPEAEPITAATPEVAPALAVPTPARATSAAAVSAPVVSAPAVSAPVVEKPSTLKPAMDLSRLSIDNNGHLYWDGKPVEVRRRVALSGAQILAATIIGLFVILGGIGAAINGSTAAFEWGCKLGWIHSNCASPSLLLPPPRPRVDIPA
jgi:hypothetical protein